MSSSIFNYLNYRDFIRDRIRDLKRRTTLSSRGFAARAGFKSPSFLKMVVDGKRNLSASTLNRMADGLRLTKSERRYFEALVLFTQAGSPEERDLHYQKLMQQRRLQKLKTLDEAQYTYFSNWYSVAIREAMACGWGKRSKAELAAHLEISEHQVTETVTMLESLGLIRRSTRQGYEVVDAAVQTPSEVRSLVIRNFHRTMMNRALLAMDSVPLEQREFGSLTIALSEEGYVELQRRLTLFRRELNALFSGDPNARSVYQLNFQLFPLLKTAPK